MALLQTYREILVGSLQIAAEKALELSLSHFDPKGPQARANAMKAQEFREESQTLGAAAKVTRDFTTKPVTKGEIAWAILFAEQEMESIEASLASELTFGSQQAQAGLDRAFHNRLQYELDLMHLRFAERETVSSGIGRMMDEVGVEWHFPGGPNTSMSFKFDPFEIAWEEQDDCSLFLSLGEGLTATFEKAVVSLTSRWAFKASGEAVTTESSDGILQRAQSGRVQVKGGIRGVTAGEDLACRLVVLEAKRTLQLIALGPNLDGSEKFKLFVESFKKK